MVGADQFQQQLAKAAAFKEALRNEGKTLSAWAREHGFKENKVIRVVNGFDKGNYGKAHEIAVAMGIKPGPQKS